VNFVVKAIFMKVKICGMKYPDNILEVSPDYMGFIFGKIIAF
jgi:phosphoribosylanthranilate isomerase